MWKAWKRNGFRRLEHRRPEEASEIQNDFTFLFFFFRFLYCFQSCREIERATRTSESVGPAIHPPNYRAGLEVFLFFHFPPFNAGSHKSKFNIITKEVLAILLQIHTITQHTHLGLRHSSGAVCRLHIAMRVCCVIVCASWVWLYNFSSSCIQNQLWVNWEKIILNAFVPTTSRMYLDAMRKDDISLNNTLDFQRLKNQKQQYTHHIGRHFQSLH